ncbi:hypothetical protein BD779DRAFT_1556651 [Infundibulicybe gibba]|nr:hypothetical protein BD779DRAFT_1556651 [Infundibulicybe gibba]
MFPVTFAHGFARRWPRCYFALSGQPILQISGPHYPPSHPQQASSTLCPFTVSSPPPIASDYTTERPCASRGGTRSHPITQQRLLGRSDRVSNPPGPPDNTPTGLIRF